MTSCSILIPTFNRPVYLKRLLAYYDDYESTFNIVIADSSSDDIRKLNAETISSFSNLNVQYLEYSSEIHLFHKIADALNHVNTKYCVICADDDFITPNGIKQAVDFLEKNRDFTIAHGNGIRFWSKTGKGNKQRFSWGPRFNFVPSITLPDPSSRLTYHLSNRGPTFYDVHRTDLLKLILEETVKFTSDWRFGELLPSVLTLIYGKMKYLEVFYAARGPGLTARTSKPLIDFIRDGTYDEKYRRFRECLSIHLSKQSQLDIEESRKVIDNAWSGYMKRVHVNYHKATLTNFKNILINRMGDTLDFLNLPDWMDNGIRKSYRKLFSPPGEVDISPSSKYYDDCNKIRLHVLSYPRRDG